jgi:hypothetical protein
MTVWFLLANSDQLSQLSEELFIITKDSEAQWEMWCHQYELCLALGNGAVQSVICHLCFNTNIRNRSCVSTKNILQLFIKQSIQDTLVTQNMTFLINSCPTANMEKSMYIIWELNILKNPMLIKMTAST